MSEAVKQPLPMQEYHATLLDVAEILASELKIPLNDIVTTKVQKNGVVRVSTMPCKRNYGKKVQGAIKMFSREALSNPEIDVEKLQVIAEKISCEKVREGGLITKEEAEDPEFAWALKDTVREAAFLLGIENPEQLMTGSNEFEWGQKVETETLNPTITNYGIHLREAIVNATRSSMKLGLDRETEIANVFPASQADLAFKAKNS